MEKGYKGKMVKRENENKKKENENKNKKMEK
jgi:hypothetical protein